MGCTLPKCAVINDLSGFGRCSLTVTIPILSAMGIQTCPLPTAILSNHTGYDNFYFADFTQHMREYYSKWDELNLSFDAIYTGFLGNAQQIEIILDFIDKFKSEKTLLFVDPVMGDNGDIYATYDKNLCSEMRRLVARADIITPNLTEACILAGVPYIDGPAVREKIFSVGEALVEMGPRTVIITGVKSGDKVMNFVVTRENNERFCETTDFIAQSYCGTGDVFASLMCGYLMRGMPQREALRKTTELLVRIIRYSDENDVPPLDGIAFEGFLKEL